jgi:hypothetical protein
LEQRTDELNGQLEKSYVCIAERDDQILALEKVVAESKAMQQRLLAENQAMVSHTYAY